MWLNCPMSIFICIFSIWFNWNADRFGTLAGKSRHACDYSKWPLLIACAHNFEWICIFPFHILFYLSWINNSPHSAVKMKLFNVCLESRSTSMVCGSVFSPTLVACQIMFKHSSIFRSLECWTAIMNFALIFADKSAFTALRRHVTRLAHVENTLQNGMKLARKRTRHRYRRIIIIKLIVYFQK